MNYVIKEGNYTSCGVQVQKNEITFTFEAEKEDECKVIFYDKNQKITEVIEVPAEYCRGAIRSVSISGKFSKTLRYNYEINGKVITDPYATRIVGREKWADKSRAACDYQVCGGYASSEFEWNGDAMPEVARREMVMYKLHVRGFSMDMGKRGKSKGTFLAVREHIPYLKKLGITTVEFMPVYEFEEFEIPVQAELPEYLLWQAKEEDVIKSERRPAPEKLNYWGYVPGNYFAVKASYAGVPDPEREWKELVRDLHANGMECIMEMFFAEGQNQNVILDALRYWVREYHVDGFHLLGQNLPITAIAQDAWLRRTKIFYAGFDGMLLEAPCRHPHLFAYNDEYLYPVRALLNHMNGNLDTFVCQQRKQHMVQGFVNYIADNNGFSLMDIFSYSEKHNQANGEDNYDGNNWNLSNNYGVEGKTAKKHINEIRERQMCNALATVMLGQGVPLFFMGDEVANSQEGNNNAYCQDNCVGWVNWRKNEKYRWLTEFLGKMAEFRRNHPVISSECPKKMSDYGKKGFPDLSYHGENAWISDIPMECQSVGIMYCGAYEKKADGSDDDMIYVGYNFHVRQEQLALPKLPNKKKWYLCMDTARGREAFLAQEEVQATQQITLERQSIVILIGK